MKKATYRSYQERILRATTYLEENLDQLPSLEQVAKVACFSPFHFHRVFRGMTGESLEQHIRRLRIDKAARRLKNTDISITDIAFEAGFRSLEGFSRAFKAQVGISPSDYRSSRIERAIKGNDFASASVKAPVSTVELKVFPERRVAFVRHVGSYETCGRAWDRLLPQIGAEGRLGGDSIMLGLCHDDPDVTDPEKIRYDACVVVDEDFAPRDDIGVKWVGGGLCAVTTHVGSYGSLAETYLDLIGRWLPRSGREARAEPCLEVYLNDPEGTDPDDLITDIYLPLED